MRSVPLIALAAVFITYLLGMFIVPDLAPFRSLQAALPWVTGGVVSQTFFLITSLLLMRWVGRKPFRVYGFRLADRRSVLIPIGLAVGITLAGMVISSVLTMLSPGNEPSAGLHPAARYGFWHMALSVWVYASLCEEVFFRGWLQTELGVWGRDRARMAFSPPVLIPALLFSFGHLCLIGILDSGMLLSVLIMTFGIGWLAGYWRQKTGSLLPAYLIHFTANAVGSGLPLLLTRLMS
jgi:membrane protease YdiL (CAAX protease family)